MVCFPIFGLSFVVAFIVQFALANHVVPALPQSFFFDWNDVTQPVPVPTTAQCDTIQIKWSRATATGPNPTAPYYLQIYTSTSTFPFIVSAGAGLQYNLPIPFAPSTQYQICMFDTNGNTGGCQAAYTVYPAPNTTVPPTCTNMTYPTATLDVEGTVINGPLSQYGWIDQCTDLTLTPKNGTPPYTMTIAPALHPPFNITSNTQDPITWTVSLSYASPFFVSLVDSTGLAWSNGPLHSGGGGSTDCLALSAGSKVATPVAIGSAVGALGLGAIIAIIFMALFNRRKYGRLYPHSSRSSLDTSAIAAPGNARFGMVTPLDTTVNRLSQAPGTVGQYEIEPFAMPSDPSSRTPTSPPTHPSAASDSQSDPSSGPPQRSHVYVVHHDAGRAPVTVYADGDADIVELPPTYARQGDSDQAPFRTQRRPGPSPRKASNPSTSYPSVS